MYRCITLRIVHKDLYDCDVDVILGNMMACKGLKDEISGFLVSAPAPKLGT